MEETVRTVSVGMSVLRVTWRKQSDLPVEQVKIMVVKGSFVSSSRWEGSFGHSGFER